MKRIGLTFLSIALGAAAIPAVAPAASYDVLVCHSAPGHVNHAFTAVNDNPLRLQAVDNCAGGDEQYTGGLYAADLLGSGFTTPEGQQVLWRMTAPAGLTITRWQSVPYLRNVNDQNWSTFFRTADGTVLASCKATGGNCIGGFEYDPTPGYSPLDWTVNTTGIEFGSRCDVGSITCGNGAVLIRSLAALRSATVTITDNGQPTVANVAGTLLAGGTVSGSKTVTGDASDASGISAVRLYVDGGQVQASSLTCDFTYAMPCKDATGQSFTVDTSTLGDGPHTVAVGAVDAAGNVRQTSGTSFATNNASAPPAPGGSGGGGGGGAPKPADPVPASAPEPTVPVPSTPTVPLTPTQPTRPVTPAPVDASAMLGRPRWHGSTLSIAGKLSRLATGTVKVTLSARVHGRTYTVSRNGRIRSGKWTVNLRAGGPLARAHRLSLRVSYAGNDRVKKATRRRTISRR